MRLAYVTLRFNLHKDIYAEHFQECIILKGPEKWENIYGERYLYAKDGKKFTEMECILLRPWFGKSRRGSKLRMGVIKKNYFGVKINVLK